VTARQPAREPDRGPLADLLVVDLTRALSGPHAAMMLGDMGLRVIKVESREGDQSRSWGPPFVVGGVST
jgi:crotonobetainyl-CoA:carnitine CoA-transferase CaiB-like acyl-CoA transferase